MKTSYILLSTLTVCGSAIANPDQGRFDQQGFGGELSLLSGYTSSKSNLSTENKTKTGPLNSGASSESEFLVMPFGQVRYTFGEQQLFAGMSRDDIVEGVFALELGYAFEIEQDSALSFSFLPTIAKGEVWEDPYLVNSARKETDVSGNAYRIQYDNMAGLGIDSEFAYYDRDIENERSGSTSPTDTRLLNRDGSGYLLGISTALPVNQSIFIMPSLQYHTFDADGKAMAFNSYSAGLTTMYMTGRNSFSINASYAAIDYDSKNPLFNTTREDSEYSLNLAYEYRDFLGWKDVGFNVLAGYENKDSNINFYDTSGYMVGVGVSYLF